MLSHVSLTVGDRERSAAFYGEHLGMTERVFDDGDLLVLGGVGESMLALREGEVPSDLPRANHFGFRVDDGDAVRAARERFRAAGVTEDEWQDDHGFVRVQVLDPDGYRVEVFSHTADVRRPPRSRWASFTADPAEARPRVLSEEGNPHHRVRVEHNRATLLVHLSDEDGSSWTVLAVDRESRRWAVAQARRQRDAAESAFAQLYGDG